MQSIHKHKYKIMTKNNNKMFNNQLHNKTNNLIKKQEAYNNK